MAQFLYDRGGFWQLKEYEECAFLPYRKIDQEDPEGGGRATRRSASASSWSYAGAGASTP